MSIFSIVDRKLYGVVIALVCVACFFVFPLTASAAQTDYDVYDAAYDCNADGIIDESDVELILNALIETTESGYQVRDLVKAKRILKATAPKLAPVLKEFLVSEMEVSEGNNMFHINFLMSDFHFVVHEDNEAIYFEFLENGITYYSIEWTKGVNIVYNVDLNPDDCIVSRDIADVSLKVFIDNGKYVLDVVDRPCIYHYPVNTFRVVDVNTRFLINFVMSDFDKDVVEDTEKVSLKLSKDGITYHVIEWDKAENVVNKSISSEDCICSFDYFDTTYQVFIDNGKYLLNVVEPPSDNDITIVHQPSFDNMS